jgi:hypothetical protein
MARYVARIVVAGQDLSQEAEMVVQEAAAPLRQWMDDSIDKLHKEFSGKIDEAAKNLEQEAKEISADLEKLGKDLEALVSEIENIKLNLPPGSNPQLVAASKQAVAEMKDYLAQREKKWKGAGATVVKALMTAKTAMTGIP